MSDLTVDDAIVDNHVTVMESCSDELRRDEQSLGLAADLNEREPYSTTDPGVGLETAFSDALESYEGSLAVLGDELLVLARMLTQHAGQASEIDTEIADRMRAIAEGVSPGGGEPDPATLPPAPRSPGPCRRAASSRSGPGTRSAPFRRPSSRCPWSTAPPRSHLSRSSAHEHVGPHRRDQCHARPVPRG
ncbi:hypothetical protein [Litorihabitans aurantiacus]|uniref:hypothetical protein n=1 Tax=Litorihabitans aurantiacus TaxID=1930061 RepID=UPI0024E164FA|nr:hypothetical protein [Litorihabitans aurantiacus]